MKKIQGRYQIGLVFVVLVCMASTCKIVANQNLGVEKVSSVKNTQALILVQDINYDVIKWHIAIMQIVDIDLIFMVRR